MTNEEKLAKLLSLMDSDGLTEAKFKAHFKRVLEFVKKNKDEMDVFMKRIAELNTKLTKKIEQDNSNSNRTIVDKMSKEIANLKEKYSDFMANVELRVAEIKDGQDGANGKDGNTITSVKTFFNLPKQASRGDITIVEETGEVFIYD